MEGRASGTPASALRLGFREVSDRASVKMVCCARAISLMWMILRPSRRMDAEALYDRARRGPRARFVTLRPTRFEISAGVGRARVFRRPRGATTSGALATDRRTKNAVTPIRESATPCDAATTRYIFGSSMMCAFGVPGNINHGVPSAGFTERPVDAAVAPGR